VRHLSSGVGKRSAVSEQTVEGLTALGQSLATFQPQPILGEVGEVIAAVGWRVLIMVTATMASPAGVAMGQHLVGLAEVAQFLGIVSRGRRPGNWLWELLRAGKQPQPPDPADAAERRDHGLCIRHSLTAHRSDLQARDDDARDAELRL
jgi:hypothetical protein